MNHGWVRDFSALSGEQRAGKLSVSGDVVLHFGYPASLLGKKVLPGEFKQTMDAIKKRDDVQSKVKARLLPKPPKQLTNAPEMAMVATDPEETPASLKLNCTHWARS